MKINKRKLILIGCIGYNLLIFIILCVFGNPVFATNDDYRMRLIISGAYTGVPNGSAVFISNILGNMLASLYRICPGIEWYGLFTMLSMYIPVCLCEYIFLKRVQCKKEFFERMSIIVIFTFLILQKHILLPQFTITAAFWAMLAIASVLEIFNIYEESRTISKKWIISFFISCILSCFVRKKIFYMCIPMIILLVIIGCHKYRDISYKKVIFIAIGILGLILTNEGTNVILNKSQMYQEFTEFNKARSGVYDYIEIPDYWENKDFYDSLGMDIAAWENLNNRTFDISDSINTSNLKKVREYAKEAQEDNIIYKLWKVFDDIRGVISSKMIYFQLIGFGLVTGIIMFQSSWKIRENSKKLILSYLVYIIIVILGMAYAGRILDRLVEALLFFCIGALFASASIGEQTREEEWFKIGKISITSKSLLSIGIILIVGVTIIANQYTLQRDATGIRSVVLEKTDYLKALTEYMEDKEESFLFYNALDFISASESVFSERKPNISNVESLGNWNVFSPNYYTRNEHFGFESAIQGLTEKDNVYYAEIGEFHASIEGEVEKKNKQLVWVEQLNIGENVINIYKTEEKEGE